MLEQTKFEAVLNQVFRAKVADQEVELTLTEVSTMRAPEGYESYSMLMQGPKEPALEQAIHQLHNETMGTLDLFLTPVAGDAEGYDYEIVVNRKLEE